jgi:DNA-directed RNA polymerase specialized sigma24 family protein
VPAPLNHEQFMRVFLQSERELLRYVMAPVPNVSDAWDVVQETALALWREIGTYDPAKPFIPWACRFALNEARVFLRKAFRQRRVLRDDVATLLEQKRLAAATDLIHAFLDGRATDAESDRLNELLLADPAARETYVQLADMHSCLAVDEQLWVRPAVYSGNESHTR